MRRTKLTPLIFSVCVFAIPTYFLVLRHFSPHFLTQQVNFRDIAYFDFITATVCTYTYINYTLNITQVTKLGLTFNKTRLDDPQ